MREKTIQPLIDLRALDECICGHKRANHDERTNDCVSCGCNLFSKTSHSESNIVAE